MPMYDYRCGICGTVFDELVSSSTVADTEIKCPNCIEYKAERLLSAPNVAVGKTVRTTSCENSPDCSAAASGFS